MTLLRFASLGSGSRGNATLIQSDESLLLVDCGFAARELEARCHHLGVSAADIDAILVTHEHGDHIRGVGAVSRRFRIPVWMTHGTRAASDCGELTDCHEFNSHDGSFNINDFGIQPMAVPHDAREPSQFVFRHKERKVGLLTDVGSITEHICHQLDGVDALILETNHDVEMLATGPYPPALKSRVAGDYGHLNNHQSAELLASIDHERLKHLVAAHLSEKNNMPEKARHELLRLDESLAERLAILQQDRPSQWFELN